MPNVNSAVLYVEDEESDRLLMRIAFASQGLEAALKVVNDGRLALDYLSGSGPFSDRELHPLPHVVLLDLNLPEINGFDVLKWIRAHPSHSNLPVVVFTSSERDEDQTRARLLGATDFAKKPNSPAGFREIARRLCQRWGIGAKPARGDSAIIGQMMSPGTGV